MIPSSVATPPGLLRAWAWGAGAALLGAALYYAVVALTGYELGVVALLVGWLVGSAVRAGSGRVGGRRYQLMAVGLTYLAIVSTSVPRTLEALGAFKGKPAGTGVGYVVLTTLLTAGLAVVAPFTSGMENALGLVIIGVSLYEAWRLNRAPVV
ncbi:MAG: hypothetical protein AB2A00_06500 [Myxococcota bacterium]